MSIAHYCVLCILDRQNAGEPLYDPDKGKATVARSVSCVRGLYVCADHIDEARICPKCRREVAS